MALTLIGLTGVPLQNWQTSERDTLYFAFIVFYRNGGQQIPRIPIETRVWIVTVCIFLPFPSFLLT